MKANDLAGAPIAPVKAKATKFYEWRSTTDEHQGGYLGLFVDGKELKPGTKEYKAMKLKIAAFEKGQLEKAKAAKAVEEAKKMEQPVPPPAPEPEVPADPEEPAGNGQEDPEQPAGDESPKLSKNDLFKLNREEQEKMLADKGVTEIPSKEAERVDLLLKLQEERG